MADVTKSIGTTGRDYSTITSWEAAHTNAVYTSAGSHALGECYDDSAFDEAPTLGGAESNITERTLTVAAGERHDGTAGTGARNVRTGSSGIIGENDSLKSSIKWLEIDMNGNDGTAAIASTSSSHTTGIKTVANTIIHDLVSTANQNNYGISFARGCDGMNNIIYDINCGTGISQKRAAGINSTSTLFGDSFLYNNTIYNVTRTGGDGDANAFRFLDDANFIVKNNIGMGTSISGTGDGSDFYYTGTNPDGDYNLSEDDTADDAGEANNLISKTTANQFVSITGGSEDLHLKSGADAIDAGVDLADSPAGTKDDINGYDRDADSLGYAATWDIGGPAGSRTPAGLMQDEVSIVAPTDETHDGCDASKVIIANCTDYEITYFDV